MAQPFYEDMGRKARWFHEIHGSTDYGALDRLRDKAFEHVDVMRQARINRADPGGGRIDKASVLLGGGRKARITSVDLPGHCEKGFITGAVEVTHVGSDACTCELVPSTPCLPIGERSRTSCPDPSSNFQ